MLFFGLEKTDIISHIHRLVNRSHRPYPWLHSQTQKSGKLTRARARLGSGACWFCGVCGALSRSGPAGYAGFAGRFLARGLRAMRGLRGAFSLESSGIVPRGTLAARPGLAVCAGFAGRVLARGLGDCSTWNIGCASGACGVCGVCGVRPRPHSPNPADPADFHACG